ncbi:MAG TPA: GAF domain-containing protein [Candidatus Tumulicola sp.]|nr:GAF domain-containing protein [Candidatus Tumulicola sp.]
MTPLKAFVTFVCERLSLAVVAVCTVLMALVFVLVEVHSTHIGYYPLKFENNTNVVQVAAGAPGGTQLQTGDRIDLGALTPQQRFSLTAPRSDGKMTVQVTRDGRTFPVQIEATPPDYSHRATLARDIGIPLSFFLSLGLASALFLMRPRPITLAFYIYTMLMLVKVYQTPLDLAGWPLNVASDLAIQVVYPAAQLMILIFAHRLYGRHSRAWPWIMGTALVLSALVFIAWVDPIVWITFQRFGFPGPSRIAMSGLDTLLLIAVLCGLAYIASGAKAYDRRRVTWVIAGIALAPILDLTWAVSDVISALIGDTSTPLLAIGIWTDALAPWFGLLGVIFVLYGFLSQRVVDFRFVIGRAVLYGTTTLILVLLFGVVEWWAEQIFESTRPALYVSLAAALLIGFTLKALHERIEDFLNTFFFREQHRAEEALRRAARALANTSSAKTVVDFLIAEPVAVLGLSSAALFLASERDGAFEREAAAGWTSTEVERIDSEDPLIVALRADLAPIALDGRQLTSIKALPGGAKTPSLVMPLIMRGNVFGFVFYGHRSDGVPLTDDERSLLEAIARNAAAAYDHIDADRSRARIRTLEARLREFGATIPAEESAPAL